MAAGFRDPNRLRLGFQGPLYRRADFTEVTKAVQRAWAAGEQPETGPIAARKRPPANGSVQSAQALENQAAAQHAIGMVLLDLDNASGANEHLTQALRVRRRLVEDDQSGPSSRVELAETLMGLAELDWKAGLRAGPGIGGPRRPRS